MIRLTGLISQNAFGNKVTKPLNEDKVDDYYYHIIEEIRIVARKLNDKDLQELRERLHKYLS